MASLANRRDDIPPTKRKLIALLAPHHSLRDWRPSAHDDSRLRQPISLTASAHRPVAGNKHAFHLVALYQLRFDHGAHAYSTFRLARHARQSM